jgi:UDP-N-acetyl-D-mannosaminuronic acid transferase (WecB/TagA/CpsF family)
MLFCNINFNQKSKSNLFEHASDNKAKLIITVNAAFIVEANTSRRFFEVLNNNYVTFDGRIPYLIAKILYLLGLIPR